MLTNAVLEDFHGDRDMANLRTVGLPDGTEIKLDRLDPYGLIKVNFQGKDTPEPLSGMYTSFEQAKNAIASYIHSLSKVEKKKK